jgi:HK97 family phage major capsid protein
MKHTQNETWRTLALAGNSDELRRVRSHVLERAEKLLDGALADGRDLDSDENREFETLKQQAKELGTLVEQSAQRRQRIEQATARYKQDSETSLEWRSFLKGDAVRIEADFGQILANRVNRTERRDLATTSGFSSVPTRVIEGIVLRLVTESAVLQASPRTFTTAGGETLKVAQATAYGTASFVSEGSAFPENDPTAASVSLSAYKVGRLLQVSNELIADTEFDIERYLGEELGTSLGIAVAEAVDGTNIGTSTVQGAFSTASSIGVTGTAAGGAPTAGEMISLYYSVNPRYQANGSWLMNPTTLQHLTTLNDTTGRSLLLPALSQQTPTTLLGRPVYTSTSVAAYGSGVSSVIFGDISRFYYLRIAGGVKLVSSPDFSLNTDQVTYRISTRVDGRVVDTSAAKRFRGAS